MIPVSDFIKVLKLENGIIHEQTKNLSQEHTLIQPPAGGNCMNWVLGHLLDNQMVMLDTLHGPLPFKKDQFNRYTRESEPVLGEEGSILPLEELLVDLDIVHRAIVTRLEGMQEEDFTEEIRIGDRPRTLGYQVFFLHFHYTYHIGQLEPLRQLAGFHNKVI